MSGPVGATGLTVASASSARPACATQRQQQQLRAGALRTQRQSRALCGDAGDVAQLERIAGGDDEPLLAPRERDQHRVVQAGRNGDRLRVRRIVVAIEPMQVDRGRDHLAAREPLQSGLAAFRQAREPRAAFAQRPFQQRIVAAADDRRRRRMGKRGRPGIPGGEPAIERRLRKQPFAGHLRAGHGGVGDQLIELALRQPEIGGGFFGGQQFRHAESCNIMNMIT